MADSWTITEALRRDGVVLVPAVDVFGAVLWQDIRAAGIRMALENESYISKRRSGEVLGREFKPGFRKDYLVRMAADGHPWDAIAQHPLITDVAKWYLGAPPDIRLTSLWYNIAVRDTPRDSQLWHYDYDAPRLLKVFLYLSDVGDDCGPLEYVRGTQGRTNPPLPYYQDAVGVPRIADDMVQDHIAPDRILKATGPAGTLVFADTSGLHRGGFVQRDRYLYTVLYVPKVCAL